MLLEHEKGFLIVFNPFVQVVDLPDGIIVADHIDQNLVNPCFLQFCGGLFLDEACVGDHLEPGIVLLELADRGNEFLQGNFSMFICSTADENTKGTLGPQSIDHLKKGFRSDRRDHRLQELSPAMTALQIALFPSHTDGCKSVLLGRDFVRVIRNDAGDGEGEFISEVFLPYPEGLGLKVTQRCLNELFNHSAFVSV